MQYVTINQCICSFSARCRFPGAALYAYVHEGIQMEIYALRLPNRGGTVPCPRMPGLGCLPSFKYARKLEVSCPNTEERQCRYAGPATPPR